MTFPSDLQLTQDEALVSSALLHRVDIDVVSPTTLTISDTAEQVALIALEAALERSVTTLFSPDYGEQLSEARRRLRERAEPATDG